MKKNWQEWPPEEIEILKARYPTDTTKDIANALGRSPKSIYTMAQKLGLSKPVNHSLFKVGNTYGKNQHKKAPIGNFRYAKDGTVWVKMSLTGTGWDDYVAVHHLVWELHHGPIPPQHHISFKDGNKENTAPENLELLSPVDKMNRNTHLRLPKELRQAIRLKGAITQAINRREKQ